MASERELRFTVVGNIDERSLRRTETRLQKFGKNTSALSGGAALSGRGGLGSSAALLKGGGVGIALGLAGQKALEFTEAASNLNEQLSKSNVIFGTSARTISDWSETTAESFGIARTEAVQAAATFGSLFTNTGTSAQAAAGLSQTLVELAGDLASFNNTSTQDALDALRSGLSGEIEPLRRFQVFLTEATVAQQAMADTGKKSSKELTQGEKILARYKLILAQTSKAQGDFARTSGSLANQQRALAAKTADLEAKLGKVLLPTITNLVTGLNDAIDGATLLGTALQNLADTPPIRIPIEFVNSGGKAGSFLKEAFLLANPATRPFDILRLIGKLGGGDGTKDFSAAEAIVAPGEGRNIGSPRKTPDKTGSSFTREQSLLLQQERAKLNNYLSDDLKVAKAIVSLRERQLRNAKPKERYEAEQKLIQSQQDLYSVQTDIANNAATQAKKGTDILKKSGKKAADALKKQAEAFKDQADAIKSAVLSAFDSKTQKIDNARALEDAKKALAQARQLGGPGAIKLAMRDVVDAKRAIDRQTLSEKNFRVTAGPPGPVNSLAVGNVVININGANDPDVIAQKVLGVLRKKAKQTATATSGRLPNQRPY